MIAKTLDETFDELVANMCDSIELGANDEDSSFSFYYEDYGYLIEGSGRVGGNWCEDGDGYWTPREYYLKYGWGYLDELTITHYDEETDEETEFPDEIVNGIFSRLDKELSRYMKNY